MTSASVEWLLQVLSFLCCLVTIVRLIQLKLVQGYPLLFSYLSITSVLQAVVVRFGVCSPHFCLAFRFLEPVRNIGYILMVWELVSVVSRNCPRLRPLGRWPVGVAGIATIGLILTFVAPGSNLFHGPTLGIVRLERGITFSLAIVTIVLLIFISKHTLSVPRSSVVLGTLYSIWFLGNSAILLTASLLPAGRAYVVNDSLAFLEIGLYAGVTVLLSMAAYVPPLPRGRGLVKATRIMYDPIPR